MMTCLRSSGHLYTELKVEDHARALRGAQILVQSLSLEGVDVLFGYPGGANLEIFDVLQEYGLRCIRVEHEQGAAHAAEGFARATGRVGVCLAPSGPGVTNLVTGIADANSDSVPIIALTGNVPSYLLGKNAFQEVDIVAITSLKEKYPPIVADDCGLTAQYAIALLSRLTDGNALVTLGVGQHQIRAMQHYRVRQPALSCLRSPQPC